MSRSECDHVFADPVDPTEPLAAWILQTQMTALKQKINAHAGAGIHACRHTLLTEAGKHTDPFTLQSVAGHDSIRTTMRHVHPQEDTVETLVCSSGVSKARWRGCALEELDLTRAKVGARMGRSRSSDFWMSLTNL
jgi:hypothetical protein